VVGRRDQHGDQQVIDMELGNEERVLGARLIAAPHAGPNPAAMLLLLTQNRLLVHELGV
jgi:hypothetical protein